MAVKHGYLSIKNINREFLKFPHPQYPHKDSKTEVELINKMYDAEVHGINGIPECEFRFAILYGDFINEVVVSEERKCRIEEMTEDKYEELKKSLIENCPKKEICDRCCIDKGDCRLLHGWKKEGAVYKHSYTLLGEYLPDSKTVILYVNNIDDACGKPTYNGVLSTYIHELFHAYYHYVTEQKQAEYNYIREIEEAMTEFSTLVFLRFMKNEYSYEWCDIFDWALESIGEKQNKVGILPAYGFGRFLFDNIPENEAFDWINKYAERLGYIDENDKHVQQYQKMVCPCYPTEPEKCLGLLRKILFGTNNRPVKISQCKGNRPSVKTLDDRITNDLTQIYNNSIMPLKEIMAFVEKYKKFKLIEAEKLSNLVKSDDSEDGVSTRGLPGYFTGDRKAKTVMVMLNPGIDVAKANNPFTTYETLTKLGVTINSLEDFIASYLEGSWKYGEKDYERPDNFDLKQAAFLKSWDGCGVEFPDGFLDGENKVDSESLAAKEAKKNVLMQKLQLELIPYASRTFDVNSKSCDESLFPYVGTLFDEIFRTPTPRKYVIFCSDFFDKLFKSYEKKYPGSIEYEKTTPKKESKVIFDKNGKCAYCSPIRINWGGKSQKAVIAHTFPNRALSNAYKKMQKYGAFCYKVFNESFK